MEFQRTTAVILTVLLGGAACKSSDKIGSQSGALGAGNVGGSAGRVVQVQPLVVDGQSIAFDLNDAVIKTRYPLSDPWEAASKFVQKNQGQMPTRRFGIFELLRPNASPLLIPEMLFPGDDDGWWLKPIPVSDDPNKIIAKAGTQEWRGSGLVDAVIRQSLGLKEPDPFVALGVFGHPEIWKGAVFDLANSDIGNLLKFEQGQTHVGFYVGEGRTRNSPPDYHSGKWGVEGYPVNLLTLSYLPVANDVFLKNLHSIVEVLQLHGGPKAPINYKQDILRAVSLQETLDHFRGWVDHEWIRPVERRIYGKQAKPFFWYLKNQEAYATNCSEFVMIAANLAVNVPMNIESFREVWGKNAGEKLWGLVSKELSHPVTYNDFGDASHPPLWKKIGLKSPTRSKKVGAGLLWDPLSTADMFSFFIKKYANWTNISASNTLIFMLGMAPELIDRMKINPNEYFAALTPIVRSMFRREREAIAGASYVNRMIDHKAYENYLRAALLDSPAVQASQNFIDQTHTENMARFQAESVKYTEALKLHATAKIDYAREMAAFNRGELLERPELPALPIPPMPVTSQSYQFKSVVLQPLFDELVQQKTPLGSLPLSDAWDLFLQDVQSPMRKLRNQVILTAFPGTDQVSMMGPDGQSVVGVRFYSPPQLFQRILDHDVILSPFARVVPIGNVFDSAELQEVSSGAGVSYRIE